MSYRIASPDSSFVLYSVSPYPASCGGASNRFAAPVARQTSCTTNQCTAVTQWSQEHPVEHVSEGNLFKTLWRCENESDHQQQEETETVVFSPPLPKVSECLATAQRSSCVSPNHSTIGVQPVFDETAAPFASPKRLIIRGVQGTAMSPPTSMAEAMTVSPYFDKTFHADVVSGSPSYSYFGDFEVPLTTGASPNSMMMYKSNFPNTDPHVSHAAVSHRCLSIWGPGAAGYVREVDSEGPALEGKAASTRGCPSLGLWRALSPTRDKVYLSPLEKPSPCYKQKEKWEACNEQCNGQKMCDEENPGRFRNFKDVLWPSSSRVPIIDSDVDVIGGYRPANPYKLPVGVRLLMQFTELPFMILWVYFVYFLVIVFLAASLVRRLVWLNALVAGLLVGVGLNANAYHAITYRGYLDIGMVVRFFLIPFGVSALSALTNGLRERFMLVFPKDPLHLTIAIFTPAAVVTLLLIARLIFLHRWRVPLNPRNLLLNGHVYQ